MQTRLFLMFFSVALVAPPAIGQERKAEPVSKRLRRELPLPTAVNSSVVGIAFSPDGERLIAGARPGGTIVVFELATGKQLTKIETGRRHDSSIRYFFVTPDWRTLYHGKSKRTVETINVDGLPQRRLVHDGSIRAWDLGTGQMRQTLKHSPPRSVESLMVASDGTKLLTLEQRTGLVTDLNVGMSLWDISTKQARALPQGCKTGGIFSRDGKKLAAAALDKDLNPKSIHVLDAATLQVMRTIAIDQKRVVLIHALEFALDDRVLIAMTVENANVGPDVDATKQRRLYALIMWDVASGKKIAAFSTEDKSRPFTYWSLSPDSRTLAIANWPVRPLDLSKRAHPAKLVVIDLAAQKVMHSVVVGDKAFVFQPAFSCDGKWIAVASHVMADNLPDDVPVEDLAQPRIHLIEVATGHIRETLIAPHGYTNSVCFSPDGKTLATGSQGRVLLFDLTVPPGQLAR